MFVILNTVAGEYYTGKTKLTGTRFGFEFTKNSDKAWQFPTYAEADKWRHKNLSVEAHRDINTRIIEVPDDSTAGVDALQMPDPTKELIEEYKALLKERDIEVARLQDVASKQSGKEMLLASSLRKMTAEARLTLTESGGCDHSVGICQCSLERDVIEAELLLGILIECPKCKVEVDLGCGICNGHGVIKGEVKDDS